MAGWAVGLSEAATTVIRYIHLEGRAVFGSWPATEAPVSTKLVHCQQSLWINLCIACGETWLGEGNTMQQRTPAKDAYNTHKKFWADTGDDLDIPIDPFAIATSMGIRVYDAILGPGRSGYLDLDPTGRPVMFLNEAHSAARKRFTCAHEIGHYVDATNRGSQAGTWDRDERASRGTDPDEVYANRFAAALLMPKVALEKQIERGMTVSELATRFRVSREAMDWRLTNLGLPKLP